MHCLVSSPSWVFSQPNRFPRQIALKRGASVGRRAPNRPTPVCGRVKSIVILDLRRVFSSSAASVGLTTETRSRQCRRERKIRASLLAWVRLRNGLENQCHAALMKFLGVPVEIGRDDPVHDAFVNPRPARKPLAETLQQQTPQQGNLCNSSDRTTPDRRRQSAARR